MEPEQQPDVVFGRRLRYMREQAGLTQRHLADVMRGAGFKMHQTTIAKIEAGERAVSVGEAVQFADALGVVDLRELINVGKGRRVQAQLKVRSLELRADDYARQLEETQVLLDDTLAKLEDARAQLEKLEAEQQ
jgi:transcriptional regulator with XRE-family HTH domain